MEYEQYKDILKIGHEYKVRISEPTDMMLKDVKAYDERNLSISLDNWFNNIVKLNGKYVTLYKVSIDTLSGIPFANSTDSYYAIPFDCFEAYQTIFCNPPIDDSADVDFF